MREVNYKEKFEQFKKYYKEWEEKGYLMSASLDEIRSQFPTFYDEQAIKNKRLDKDWGKKENIVRQLAADFREMSSKDIKKYRQVVKDYGLTIYTEDKDFLKTKNLKNKTKKEVFFTLTESLGIEYDAETGTWSSDDPALWNLIHEGSDY